MLSQNFKEFIQSLNTNKIRYLIIWLVFLYACAATSTITPAATPTAPPQPFTLVKTEDYLLDITMNDHWLAWAEFHSGQVQFGVYDLIRGARLQVPNSQGGVALLDGDNLYILRQKLNPLRSSFYVLNLETGQEKLLREDVFASKTNGQTAIWQEAYPDACNKYLERSERSYLGCSVRLMALDLATGEKKELGFYNQSDGILAVTPDLVMLQGSWFGSIQAYSSPIEIVDLKSKEYRVVSTSSTGFGQFVYLIDAVGRTVAYSSGSLGEVVVLHIEPFEQAQVLVDIRGINARGLAGPDILLYSDWYPSPSSMNLIAFNMRNGNYQEIHIDDDVKQFFGSSTHLAWVNRKEQLFVTPLELRPASGKLPLSTPGPTAYPHLLPPQPLPVWKTPSPQLPLVTPTRTPTRLPTRPPPYPYPSF